MTTRIALCFAAIIAISSAAPIVADDASATLPPLKVPDGFSIELVAGPPLVERPVVAAFDDDGRLYVAESSGSNDPVEKQLAEKPHRIVRLEDTDDDGKFDRRTVFADRMMFPEGAMFFDGSLYVSAAPSIWKLTDRDGDGVAEERIEWFQGKTLTGCANDLHGPYAGPDGWIYWCKGAFAEQSYTVNGHEWKTKAAHIFRCRPDGSGFEPVLTGGMDNPVDVAFMPDGERILSGTFFAVDPRHDGLIHAIYGGVYGKDHGVLEGHSRTGELMPILDPLGAAAGCGLERYDSDVFGTDYRNNLFLCQFNLRKVSRHILKPSGSTFSSEDHDFVTSDFVDFHPTDVLTDADGSLLVVDTGGWYKLCCPTSQLWKPDVLGGIYRVRKIGAKSPADPRGRNINWSKPTPAQLWGNLADVRPAVRQRACREFGQRRDSAEFAQFLAELAKRNGSPNLLATQYDSKNNSDKCDAQTAAFARAWALTQLESDASRALIHELLNNDDEHLRHVALHAISLHRDEAVAPQVVRLLRGDSASNRRLAAEAIRRLGNRASVPHLLAAASKADDRILQHSIIYALIELADPAATRDGLQSNDPKVIAAALIALDQMPGGDLTANDVVPHLGAADDTLRHAARWVVTQHPDWGGELTEWLRTQMEELPAQPAADADRAAAANLETLLQNFSSNSAIQQLLADAAASHASTPAVRALALQVMAKAGLREPPLSWIEAQTRVIDEADPAQLPLVVAAARALPPAAATNAALKQALAAIADSPIYPTAVRVDALAIVAESLPELNDAQFQLLEQSLSSDNPVAVRSAAADALAKSHLTAPQLGHLCDVVQAAGPLEMNRLFQPFAQSQDEQLGLRLIASLRESANVSAVRIDLLRKALAKYDAAVQTAITELESLVNVDAAAQRRRIEELLPLATKGDVRRGHAVFYSTKAACSACHRLGYAGGSNGPELSNIGKTRTERDLLESILFPSLSFVRSYEPMQIVTQDGKTLNGVIRDETTQEFVVATGPDQVVRLPRADVEQIQPSKVSIMPTGLDKQLTTQELADLVAFLKDTAAR